MVGSDSGSLGQFHHDAVWQELAACLELGATPGEALEGATTAPARMLAKDDIGTVTPGARGDLVLYQGDFEGGRLHRSGVFAVINGGVVFVEDSSWIGPDREQFRMALGEHHDLGPLRAPHLPGDSP